LTSEDNDDLLTDARPPKTGSGLRLRFARRLEHIECV